MSQLANAIRFLSVDAVQKANSGHPGAPMGMAEMAEVLWTKFLNHNPANPKFYNRDRFVLSNGHASMILYSLLHLTGYNVSIDDLKNFRQLHSKTPRSSGIWLYRRRGNHNRPIGTRYCQRCGHGFGRKNLGCRIQ